MKQRYETVVLGGTYSGLGYAFGHPDCLVLEESQILGGDFHHSLRPVRLDEIPDAARDCELAGIMTEYGVWTESGFDMLKAEAVVHEYAARKLETGLQIIMDARIMDIHRQPDGVRVRFITNEGIRDVWADRLVDATVECISAPGAVRCAARTLNVFTVALERDFTERLRMGCEACCVLEGPLENEKLIQFPVSLECPLEKAYLDMMTMWKRAFPNGEEKILFVAQTFDERYEPVGGMPEGWIGERCGDPITAFWKGAMAE